jgi:BA14K-like protein
MLRLSIVGATALSLALAVGTPTFAVGLRGVHGHGGGAMHVGSGRLGGAQAKRRLLPGIEDASYCTQRWTYYDPASGKYMGDDGEWRPCR